MHERNDLYKTAQILSEELVVVFGAQLRQDCDLIFDNYLPDQQRFKVLLKNDNHHPAMLQLSNLFTRFHPFLSLFHSDIIGTFTPSLKFQVVFLSTFGQQKNQSTKQAPDFRLHPLSSGKEGRCIELRRVGVCAKSHTPKGDKAMAATKAGVT